MEVTVEELAQWTDGRLANATAIGDRAASIRIKSPAGLVGSTHENVSFFFSKEYQDELPQAAPGVLVTSDPFTGPLEQFAPSLWKGTAILSCVDPYLAMAVVTEKFAPVLSGGAHLIPSLETQIDSRAYVSPSATLGPGAQIGPFCTVADRARIGRSSVLYSGCSVGSGVLIGEACVLFPGVIVYEKMVIGDRVRIHANSVIGADGFGYAPRRKSGAVIGHQKIFHLGRVIIGNDVEIGANSCVDRGTFDDTILEDEVKLDNHVQIGHNAKLRRGAVICGSSALAGGAEVGRFAYIGGLTGITNRVKVGDGAQVAACALITKDIPAGGTGVGNPQRTYREHFKAHARLNRIIAKGKE